MGGGRPRAEKNKWWCQVEQNDSCNRLSICDWLKNTSLSRGCHMIVGHQEEQLAGSLDEQI